MNQERSCASDAQQVSTARGWRPEEDRLNAGATPNASAGPAAGNQTLGELIAKVGGRINDAGYVEFGSEMAVLALLHSWVRGLHQTLGDAQTNAYAEGRKDEAEARQWLPIATAPKDGTPFLAWYPKLKLDEDNEMTDEVCGGAQAIVCCKGNQWDEPDWLNASGAYYFDDWCFAELPTRWMPLPSDPTA